MILSVPGYLAAYIVMIILGALIYDLKEYLKKRQRDKIPHSVRARKLIDIVLSLRDGDDYLLVRDWLDRQEKKLPTIERLCVGEAIVGKLRILVRDFE